MIMVVAPEKEFLSLQLSYRDRPKSFQVGLTDSINASFLART